MGLSLDCIPPTQDNDPHNHLVPIATTLKQLM